MSEAGTQERRTGMNGVVTKLNELETDVAIIKADSMRQTAARRVIWTMASALSIYFAAALFAYGKLVNKIEHLEVQPAQFITDIKLLDHETARLLDVVVDHGTEIKTIQNEQLRQRGAYDQLHDRLVKDIEFRTDDRYRRRDWLTNKLWIDEKFLHLGTRIEHLENEHHNPKLPSLKLQERK